MSLWIGRRLNSLLSVETGYIITEGFSHHIAPPERLLCPQSLCEGSYQAINHRQSSTVAATWLLMRAFSFHQSRAGSVQGSLCLSFHASPLLSDASATFSVSISPLPLYKGTIHTLSYLWTECQGQHLHTHAILSLQ